LLFGDVCYFSQAVRERITKLNPDVLVEALSLDIITNGYIPDYAVILDRFSMSVPYYKYAMNYFAMSGVKIINGSSANFLLEDFSVLLLLKKNKIKIPKTAIIPSKSLPPNINNEDMHNLKYPLD